MSHNNNCDAFWMFQKFHKGINYYNKVIGYVYLYLLLLITHGDESGENEGGNTECKKY